MDFAQEREAIPAELNEVRCQMEVLRDREIILQDWTEELYRQEQDALHSRFV